MTIIWLLVGLGLIVLGADWLVEGASSIARKAGVSEFVIGLTIVGFGTSCPELVVSLTGALEGNADVAVGNVLGSNIFNVLFILGLTALLCSALSPCQRKIGKGTSLPELATSLVAALKGRDQLALGNILGSNVFNILLILGSSALITPLSFASVTHIDAAVLLLSVILLLLWAYTGRRERIDRWEGGIMLLWFGAYYYYLFINL